MRQTVIPALLLIGFPGSVKPQVENPFQISVSVNMVVLNPIVRDSNGRFVSDLKERNFAVYEDGVPQSNQLFRYEDIPVTVGLVVDHSGSMKPKLSDVIAAARTFARASKPEDRMFVVNFNENVTLALPYGNPIGQSSDALARAISDKPASGRTALYDAIIQAFGQLPAASPEKKVLIVISDGGDNASSHTLGDVLKIAGQSSALVYTIGIFDENDADRNPGVLSRLARATGGEAFFPRQYSEAVEICESIARDIRNQYTIGYASTNAAKPGAWRSIRLTAAAPEHGKLTVRTRSGYIVGDPSK